MDRRPQSGTGLERGVGRSSCCSLSEWPASPWLSLRPTDPTCPGEKGERGGEGRGGEGRGGEGRGGERGEGKGGERGEGK